jgi:uncharacterized membrane protein YeaQ/YmgE (transglycosylase-associated protein family)
MCKKIAEWIYIWIKAVGCSLKRSGRWHQLRKLHSFIHSFIHSIIRLFIRSFIRSFIHSFIHSFFHSIIRLFIRSFFRSFIRSFIHSFIHSFIRSFIYSFIYHLVFLMTGPNPLPKRVLYTGQSRAFSIDAQYSQPHFCLPYARYYSRTQA